jgi:hypothetical protein
LRKRPYGPYVAEIRDPRFIPLGGGRGVVAVGA